MKKLYFLEAKTLILNVFLIFSLNVFSEEIKVYPWFSLSSIWGQGSVGSVIYRDIKFKIVPSFDFVYDYSEKGFTYKKLGLRIEDEELRYGINFIEQQNENEISPFVGFYSTFKKVKHPLMLYNQIEYRHNPVFNDFNDYFRSKHGITVFYKERVGNKDFYIRPYISNDFYVSYDNFDLEKSVLFVGYFMKVPKAKINVYFIPYRYGLIENSWNDTKDFGASLVFEF
jgi:hypothetical protein